MRLAAAFLLLAACATPRAIRRAEEHLAAGRPGVAVKVLEEALRRRPDDTRLQVELARALLALGQPDRALAPARAAAHAGAEEARVVLVEALLASGRAEEALDTLEGAPPSPTWEALRGEAQAATGRYAEAVETLEPVVDEVPDAAGTLAWSQALAGQEADAVEVASRIAARHRDDPELLADAAAALLLAHDPAAAEGCAVDARAAAQIHGVDAARWVRRAEALRSRGALHPALRLGMRAYVVGTNDGRAAWALGTWFLEAGLPRRAAEFLVHALEVPPYHAPGSEAVGVLVAGSRGDLSPAQRAQGRRDIAIALAEAWRRLDDPAREVEALEIAIASGEEIPPELHLRLADAADRAGQPDRALEAARQAVLRDPTLRAPALRVAHALLRGGATAQALRVAVRALAAHPSDPDLAILVADIYAGRGEFRLALEAIGPAAAAHPERADLAARQRSLVQRVRLGY